MSVPIVIPYSVGGGASGALPMETSFGSVVALVAYDEPTVEFAFAGETSFGSAVPV